MGSSLTSRPGRVTRRGRGKGIFINECLRGVLLLQSPLLLARAIEVFPTQPLPIYHGVVGVVSILSLLMKSFSTKPSAEQRDEKNGENSNHRVCFCAASLAELLSLGRHLQADTVFGCWGSCARGASRGDSLQTAHPTLDAQPFVADHPCSIGLHCIGAAGKLSRGQLALGSPVLMNRMIESRVKARTRPAEGGLSSNLCTPGM